MTVCVHTGNISHHFLSWCLPGGTAVSCTSCFFSLKCILYVSFVQRGSSKDCIGKSQDRKWRPTAVKMYTEVVTLYMFITSKKCYRQYKVCRPSVPPITVCGPVLQFSLWRKPVPPHITALMTFIKDCYGFYTAVLNRILFLDPYSSQLPEYIQIHVWSWSGKQKVCRSACVVDWCFPYWEHGMLQTLHTPWKHLCPVTSRVAQKTIR